MRSNKFILVGLIVAAVLDSAYAALHKSQPPASSVSVASVRQPAAPFASAAVALASAAVIFFALVPYVAYVLASLSQRG